MEPKFWFNMSKVYTITVNTKPKFVLRDKRKLALSSPKTCHEWHCSRVLLVQLRISVLVSVHELLKAIKNIFVRRCLHALIIWWYKSVTQASCKIIKF